MPVHAYVCSLLYIAQSAPSATQPTLVVNNANMGGGFLPDCLGQRSLLLFTFLLRAVQHCADVILFPLRFFKFYAHMPAPVHSFDCLAGGASEMCAARWRVSLSEL